MDHLSRVGTGLNGRRSPNSDTVFDDQAVDVRFGGSDCDWFLAAQTRSIRDELVDQMVDEFVFDLGGIP